MYNEMTGKQIVISLLFLICAVFLSAQERSIVLGRNDEWRSIEVLDKTAVREGWKGYQDIVLREGEYENSEEGGRADLLLHFNRYPWRDEAGNYESSGPNGRLSTANAKFGGGSAAFPAYDTGITLIPRQGSLFEPGSVWGDFTIEFWLYPAHPSEGETVILWTGNLLTEAGPLQQHIRCSFSRRRLQWEFSNVFLPPDRSDFVLELSGRQSLIPRKWSHHLLRFSAETGIVEYLKDGLPEDIAYANPADRESSRVFLPVIGGTEGNPIVLAPAFVGFLDELRISPFWVQDPGLREYRAESGRAVTKVLDLGYRNSTLKRIEAVYDAPGTSDVFFYYRLPDRRHNAGTAADEWKRFLPGREISVSGRYIQLMMELFPTGDRTESPAVSEIRIFYEPDEPPVPPARLSAEAGNGSVTLNWAGVPESDVAGYLVYYGTESGRYFGRDSSLGNSPIDAGKVTSLEVTGLENGRLYYFAVSAYDESGADGTNVLSRELSARPSRMNE
jgi:hypothetical protein